MKYLIEKGADIHINNDYLLKYSLENGYLESFNYLKQFN